MSGMQNGDTPNKQDSASKPKRVRTGCLTCRERHLKCDEGMPVCMNCRKSARECKRGVRLNFIDTQCKQPPVLHNSDDWRVGFRDESREIASEYEGGEQQYARRQSQLPTPDHAMDYEYNNVVHTNAPIMSNQPLANIQGMQLHNGQHGYQPQNVNMFDQPNPQPDLRAQEPRSNESAFSHTSLPSHHSRQESHSHHASPYAQTPRQSMSAEAPIEGAAEAKEILNTQEETLYMQVFVEEVGLWMDSLDPMKHFSRILPFHALTQPMLLNAFLACGVRHLTLVNPAAFQEEKALAYYDSASRYLLRALENPERDSVICATTAVILNVYEIMTEKALMRMNHIAGARALIKECGWDARSSGIGAACFWVNVGMEILSNLHFNWQASWNPDHWGLNLDLSMETLPGREEIWTHRIVYITAKISDFRATVPRSQESSPQEETRRRQKRYDEWQRLKLLADTWNNNIPRTMHPAAHLLPYQTRSKSVFPEIWLIKRTTMIARLFYHTAMCLLAQINPIMTKEAPEMHEMEQYHAHHICGIVAHVKDRGVASVALRALHHAAECLQVRREQEEALSIFIRIHKETGWRIGFIPVDLMEKWGWDPNTDLTPQLPTIEDPSNHYMNKQFADSKAGARSNYSAQMFDQYAENQRLQQQIAAQRAQREGRPSPHTPQSATSHQQHQPIPSPPARKLPPQGIVNPMFGNADFSSAKHPYQEYYVAPNPQYQNHESGEHGLSLGLAGLGNYPSQAQHQQHQQQQSQHSNNQFHYS